MHEKLNMSQTLKLRPRARIIRTLGDRLISGPIAAIIELIKNSHDADASYAKITFIPPLNKNDGKIIIEDDGHGMSLQDVAEKWMEPATSDKKTRKVSPTGRKMLGSKGIGRFSAARLGYFLTLETACYDEQENKYHKTTLQNIDWQVFEDTQYLDEITFPYTTTANGSATGTRLTITSLRDNWTEKYIKALYDELRTIIAPHANEAASEEGFQILLDLQHCTEEECGFDGAEIVNPEHNRNSEKMDWVIKPIPILDACDYAITGTFDDTGHFSGSIEIKRGGLKPEKITLSPPVLTKDEKNCGEIGVNLYIFDRDKEAVLSMAQRAGRGELSYKEARNILNEVAGVKIYRDNYRIRPYGDVGNDWLSLDKQRVQTPTKIGHDQVSGFIIVDSEEESGLIERSSREGFEETPEFKRLIKLLNNLFTLELNPRRYKFRKKTRSGNNNYDISFRGAKVLANLAWVEEIIDNLPADEKEAASNLITNKSVKLIRYLESLEEKHAILEAKVALGMIVAEVIHEGRTPVHFIKAETARLVKWWGSLFEDNEKAISKRNECLSIIRGLSVSADNLSSLFTTLAPLSGIKQKKPTQFRLTDLVFDVVRLFKSRTEQYGIEVSVFNEGQVDTVLGYKQDLQPALVNIIDNAIYWLEYSRTKAPEINIKITKQQSTFSVFISNNGPDIPDEYKEVLFDVGFSLKPEGSGLGLSIANETLSRGGGHLEYAPLEDGEVCFKITYPLETS